MSRRTLTKIAIVALLVAAVVVVWLTPLREQFTRENIRALVEHLRTLWYGPAAFILIFALACVFAIPASIFVVAAGFIWGWLMGSVYSIIGGLLGAVASFYVARFVGEGLLHRFGRVGRMVAKQADHAGFRSLLVLRNIPGIPFAVLNYGAGVAGVRLVDFFFATLVGIAPSMVVFNYCADSILNGSMSEGDAFIRVGIVCVLMIGIALLPRLLKRFSRRMPAVE